ncbi:MAG: Fic family protein [Bacilli bacterium]|nr:Fic family protein [Bacilli bacterium]
MNDLPLVEMQALASKKINLHEFPIEFVSEFIYNSLSFETQNLTLEEVSKVVQDEQVDLEEKKVLKIKNYKNAFMFIVDLAKNKKELDENTLKDIHEMLMNEVNIGGLYRNVDISIKGSNHTPPGHLKVYDRMKKYFDKVEEYNDDVLAKAAFSLLQLDKIHPFLDGNGKLARMVLNYHLLYNGLAPVVFPFNEKEHYFNCIEEFKVNKNIECFKEYITKLEKDALSI